MSRPRAATGTASPPPAAARVLVAVCIVVAGGWGLLRMDEVMGLFDWRADRNAKQTYLDREYSDGGAVPNRAVVEAARRTIPAEEPYRVVLGPRLESEGRFTQLVVADFLKYFLLPRRQAAGAEWVLCLGCDPDTLGGSFEVLADGGDGVLFGRIAG